MESPAKVRGARWLIAVFFVALLVGCSSEPKPTGTPETQTSTTVRRTPRTTTSTTAAPRRRPSIVVPDPGPVAETPVTDPAPRGRGRPGQDGEPPAGEQPTAPSAAEPPLTFYYTSCASAYADGAAPLYFGYEGYWEALDPDGDGVACDPPLTFYYADCDTARADGAAPLYFGYEGYWEALDPDGDGVACD